jgi:hypothetical protein
LADQPQHHQTNLPPHPITRYQAAVAILLHRMHTSFAQASQQTRASLCPLLVIYYSQMIVSGNGLQSAFDASPLLEKAIKQRLGPLFDNFEPFLRFATAFLPGLDLIQALLSIDPATGALEAAGVTDSRCKMRMDGSAGRAGFVVNGAGGVEGAMRRAGRFRRYLETRVARSEVERELLAWLWRDPVCGRPMEEWLGGCEVKEAEEEGEGEGEKLVTITWKSSEGGGGSRERGEGKEDGACGRRRRQQQQQQHGGCQPRAAGLCHLGHAAQRGVVPAGRAPRR